MNYGIISKENGPSLSYGTQLHPPSSVVTFLYLGLPVLLSTPI